MLSSCFQSFTDLQIRKQKSYEVTVQALCSASAEHIGTNKGDRGHLVICNCSKCFLCAEKILQVALPGCSLPSSRPGPTEDEQL